MADLSRFNPETAYTLYEKTFAPLLPHLKGVKSLFISADGPLYTIPFEALVTKYDKKEFRTVQRDARKGKGAMLSEYATLTYLGDSYTFTYLPSVSVLRSLRQYPKPGYGKWDKPLIAFADPVFEKTVPSPTSKVQHENVATRGISPETELTLSILTRSTGTKGLKRLPDSTQEAKAVSAAVGGKGEDIYLREKATEDNVHEADLSSSRYLLFATHGLLGGDFTGVAEPSLALTLVDNPEGTDGFLSMSEVLGLDLNAEMVVLSACNTSGQGDKTGSGEGFAGLTRSFMYAGGRSLLVTHWSVESQAARELMVGMFDRMKKQKGPAALKEAQLNMKNSTRNLDDNNTMSLAHPFFWAPFVMVGE